MADDILYVVEHIEAELQRLGRLVATLRRRIEAQHGGEPSSVTTTTVSGPVPSHPTPAPLSATRTRPSSRRFPAVIEEQDEEAMVRTASGGASYGFVREASRRRSEEPGPEPAGLRDHGPLDRRTR